MTAPHAQTYNHQPKGPANAQAPSKTGKARTQAQHKTQSTHQAALTRSRQQGEKIMNWIEKAERDIEKAYESGGLTEKEYSAEMRGLQEEARAQAQEAAEAAYNDAMGGGW